MLPFDSLWSPCFPDWPDWKSLLLCQVLFIYTTSILLDCYKSLSFNSTYHHIGLFWSAYFLPWFIWKSLLPCQYCLNIQHQGLSHFASHWALTAFIDILIHHYGFPAFLPNSTGSPWFPVYYCIYVQHNKWVPFYESFSLDSNFYRVDSLWSPCFHARLNLRSLIHIKHYLHVGLFWSPYFPARFSSKSLLPCQVLHIYTTQQIDALYESLSLDSNYYHVDSFWSPCLRAWLQL